MKQLKLVFATISLVCFANILYTQIVSSGSSVLDVFVGTSPCADVAKSFLKIPSNVSCDRIKWNLTLNQHPANLLPTIYIQALRCINLYRIKGEKICIFKKQTITFFSFLIKKKIL